MGWVGAVFSGGFGWEGRKKRKGAPEALLCRGSILGLHPWLYSVSVSVSARTSIHSGYPYPYPYPRTHHVEQLLLQRLCGGNLGLHRLADAVEHLILRGEGADRWRIGGGGESL